MKLKFLMCVGLGIAISIFSLALFAHHGTAAYDTAKVVTVKGTMNKGEVEKWQAELTAPNKMSRAGWDKHTLKPGDSITASGYVTKGGAHTMWINKLLGPDGEDLRLRED